MLERSLGYELFTLKPMFAEAEREQLTDLAGKALK